MKILFINSSYKGIYDHFEEWVLNELKKSHEVQLFHIYDGLPALKALTNRFRPEAALTLVGFKLPVIMVQWLKKQEVKTAVWFTEDPYYMDKTAELSHFYDFVFTIDSAALEFYKNNGHKHAYQLPLAANTEVFKPREVGTKYKSDICIVGFPYPDRVRFVQLLLQKTPYKIQVVGRWKQSLYRFQNNPNLKFLEGWVNPSIASNYYNGAKIVLNTHRPFNLKNNQNRLGIVGKSINNRTFDVAACASFQLIEFKDDLKDHFIENEEIVAFNQFDDLVEKVGYYIESENERKQIASKAKERVLKEHTFQHRIEKMIQVIEKPTD
jgi:spore maturation protein CgeB